MSFLKNKTQPVPDDCKGMEIKVMSSTCTGERVIGFYDRRTRELKYSELVQSDDDIKNYYKKYGMKNE